MTAREYRNALLLILAAVVAVFGILYGRDMGWLTWLW